jgi:hypothetical protein
MLRSNDNGHGHWIAEHLLDTNTSDGSTLAGSWPGRAAAREATG